MLAPLLPEPELLSRQVMSRNDEHWLREVASFAGLDLELDPQPSLTDFRRAWSRVAVASGVDEDGLAERVARHFRLDVADLGNTEPQAVKVLPEAIARKHGVLPLRITEDMIVVAAADPVNAEARHEIIEHSSRRPTFELASPGHLMDSIDAAYSPDRFVKNTLQGLIEQAASSEFQLVGAFEPGSTTKFELEAPAVVKLTQHVLQQALQARATAIHIEPGREHGRIRYRVDGVLQHYLDLPLQAQQRIVLRLRNVAETDHDAADEARGRRIDFQAGSGSYELRVQFAPTPDGEKAVLRVLEQAERYQLKKLSLPATERDRILDLLRHRDGIVLISGPTRSGKTTFLYSALNHLNTGQFNISTLENPLDVELPGITQTQFDPTLGASFAEALQNLLSQDPDVIYAGEIRDLATARVVVRASITGRLVIATLHTADAVTAVRRLLDLGLDAGRVVESVRGVVSQRLLRRLCPHCAQVVKTAKDVPARERRLAGVLGTRPMKYAVGCEACGGTGFRGQLPVPEVLVITPELSKMIADGDSIMDVEAAAQMSGMRSRQETGLEWVKKGETTLQEVERVLGLSSAKALSADASGPVLIVDDEEQDRLLMRSVLKKKGFNVVETDDGHEALEHLESRENDFSLVLLDLMMPKMDGREVLKRVRQSLRTATLPVIVLTASEKPEDEIELLESGADDFVRKPIDPVRLGARVKAVLRRAGIHLSN